MSATGLVYVEIAGAGLLGLDGGALDALRLQSLALPDNRLHRLPEKTFRYKTEYEYQLYFVKILQLYVMCMQCKCINICLMIVLCSYLFITYMFKTNHLPHLSWFKSFH